MRIRLLILPLAVALMTVVSGSAASAAPITYTEQAVISGSLGGSPFAGQEIVISWTGDTGDVSGAGFFITINAGSGTVGFDISTVGSGVFTENVLVFVNQALPAAGFASNAGGTILVTFDDIFLTYDLASDIGPIANTPFFRSDLSFSTSLGLLNISAVRDTATFTAVTDVPEPATLALFGLGLAGVLRARKRA